jgi:CHAT domain-containing protein
LGGFVRFFMILAGIALAGSTASAREARPSLQDSFRLGNTRGALCQMQSRGADLVATGMFDRAWSIVCRDAATPVGQVYALRDGAAADARLAASRGGATCAAEASDVQIADVGRVAVTQCRLAQAQVGYKVYRARIGKVTYVAQGLDGYDSALRIALRTIVTNRTIDDAITVATTGSTDPAAFARVQAGALDPAQTLAEGYRRNNAGSYAEAAEFFDTLQTRLDADDGIRRGGPGRVERQHEYLVNEALQKSNLGDFAEADTLFAAADQARTLDPVQLRLRRNFEAMHLLNQRSPEDAAKVLARPMGPIGVRTVASGAEITEPIAAEINAGSPAARRLGAASTALTPEERAAILDAQALQLSATILRLQARPGEARILLDRALADASGIRGGRVTSITRLRAQIMAEAALTHEDQGDTASAEALLRRALDLLRTAYPDTTAMNGGRARLAAFLARHGKSDEALALYRDIVSSTAANRISNTGLSNQLAPYFELLASQIPARPALVDDLFLASQTLVRPGVADTQAVLARELRDGGGESAQLFRQAISLSRDVERTRIELARLNGVEQRDASVAGLIAARQADLKTLSEQQALTFARLSEFPQYRALSTEAMTLGDLRAALRDGEAYYKMAVAGNGIYAIYADAQGATGWKLPLSTGDLADKVRALRATISVIENGQNMTYPFDVKLARELYVALFGPVAARLAPVRHLVFEPDGAMLQLPPNLLITDQAGVDRYLARAADPRADEFDFRGIAWLGRSHAVSTSVSARAFRDVRRTPPSRAARQYIGFGENAPAPASVFAASARAIDCTWPLGEWSKPIAATELRQAASLIGAPGSQVIVGQAFTDTAVRARSDLADYRILHFATHGFVTAPRPECPARPALLTSFGGGDSDGLLSFREIYDLKLDADVVILSACDTAGEASRAVTREAGVTTGGGSALDGLVRAFIGAGGRTVIASHWPAPDDFGATQRLVSGLFQQGAGQPLAFALRDAERALMDDAATSHPYYWSDFAIIGDGAQPLIAQR